MNTRIVLSDDELNELAAKVVRVMFGDGLVIEFASRAIILRRFPRINDDAKEELIDVLIQRVKIVSEKHPEIVDHAEQHVRTADHSPTSFVAHASEAYELAEDRNYENFHKVQSFG